LRTVIILARIAGAIDGLPRRQRPDSQSVVVRGRPRGSPDVRPGRRTLAWALPERRATIWLPSGHVYGEVDEEAYTSPGETPDVEAGATGKTTLSLKPGKFVMICNLPGHYKAGMYGSITAH
jgi:hypothetical protein